MTWFMKPYVTELKALTRQFRNCFICFPQLILRAHKIHKKALRNKITVSTETAQRHRKQFKRIETYESVTGYKQTSMKG